MSQVTLDFNTDDKNLNLSAVVNFRREMPVDRLFVKGLAEWRHVPANIIHVSKDTIEMLKLPENSAKLSRIGLNWVGISAQSNILISHAVRASSRSGLQKVQDQLTKFFKAIGATSVKFSVVDVDSAISDFDDDNDY